MLHDVIALRSHDKMVSAYYGIYGLKLNSEYLLKELMQFCQSWYINEPLPRSDEFEKWSDWTFSMVAILDYKQKK